MTGTTTPPATKQEFLDYLHVRWNDFVVITDALGDEQWTALADAAGWTVKDHVAHVSAWDRAVMGMLSNRTPMRETLGVTEDVWTSNDIDAVNEAIRRQTVNVSIATVRATRDSLFAEVTATYAELPEETYSQPGRDFQMARDDRTLLECLVTDGPDHYAEHHRYIRGLVDGDPG